MGQPMDIKTLVEVLKRQGRALMLPGMTDLLEMAYRKQVAMRRVAYVPNNLTTGAIKKLAHFLTDNGDNRFMIVLDGSTATGKTTLMTAMRQALRWLTDHRLVSDDVGLRILRELITERYKLRLPMVVSTNLDSDQLREHLGLRIVSRMNEMAFYIHFENEDFRKMAWYSHHPEVNS